MIRNLGKRIGSVDITGASHLSDTAQVNVAVAGCCHGELRKLYEDILAVEESKRPELLLICGDFQSLRDVRDYHSISMPEKYKRLGDFHNYYTGKWKAPITTLFIGGNHEASNYLHELKYGGYVAENIYFLGYSNVVWFKGLRIAGFSGIYKDFDYYKPHDETLPLSYKEVRSIYHTRFEDYLKLSMIRNLDVNVMLSHDWPEGIYQYGDVNYLLKKKPFFKADINKKDLGNPASMKLLNKLKPNYWFSAHLHVKFEASVKHPNSRKRNDKSAKRKLSSSSESENTKKKPGVINNDFQENTPLPENKDEIQLDIESPTNENEIQLDIGSSPSPNDNNDIQIESTLVEASINKDEIDLDFEESQIQKNDDEISLDLSDIESPIKPESSALEHSDTSNTFTPPSRFERSTRGFPKTNFLALDKILPKRSYMKFIRIEASTLHPSYNTSTLHHDLEFLKIIKWFNKFQKREVFGSLKIEDIDDAFMEQFFDEIDAIEIEDLDNNDNLVVQQTFAADLANPKSQTDSLLTRFNF